MVAKNSPTRPRRRFRSLFQRCEGAIGVALCVPEDQLDMLPPGVTTSPNMPPGVVRFLPAGSDRPRVGEVIYLTSTSAWVVSIVVHELLGAGRVRVEIWLECCGSARVRYSDRTVPLQ